MIQIQVNRRMRGGLMLNDQVLVRIKSYIQTAIAKEILKITTWNLCARRRVHSYSKSNAKLNSKTLRLSSVRCTAKNQIKQNSKKWSLRITRPKPLEFLIKILKIMKKSFNREWSLMISTLKLYQKRWPERSWLSLREPIRWWKHS